MGYLDYMKEHSLVWQVEEWIGLACWVAWITSIIAGSIIGAWLFILIICLIVARRFNRG